MYGHLAALAEEQFFAGKLATLSPTQEAQPLTGFICPCGKESERPAQEQTSLAPGWYGSHGGLAQLQGIAAEKNLSSNLTSVRLDSTIYNVLQRMCAFKK